MYRTGRICASSKLPRGLDCILHGQLAHWELYRKENQLQREATFGWTGLVARFASFLLSSISGSKRAFQSFSNKDSIGVARLHWRAALITTTYIQIRSLGHGVILVTLGKVFTVSSETSACYQEKRQKASLGHCVGKGGHGFPGLWLSTAFL